MNASRTWQARARYAETLILITVDCYLRSWQPATAHFVYAQVTSAAHRCGYYKRRDAVSIYRVSTRLRTPKAIEEYLTTLVEELWKHDT